ncbi:MAG TPA: hypothetical protein VIY99_14540 [Terracidiphilus sp.]
MNHLSEEQLIELHDHEDSPDAARHLDSCSECARAYEALRADLADLTSAAVPPRDAHYGEHVWQAIADRLPVYAQAPNPWYRRPLWLGMCSAAACSVLVVAAFYAGRTWEHRQPQPHPTIAQSAAPPSPPRIVVVLMSDHLDRSERFLVELKHASADDTELANPLRDEARSLLVANRKCRQEAEQDNDPALTHALDHLNQLLSEMANQPGGLNAASISRLKSEMNAEGLLFEVRVLRSRLPKRHLNQNGGNA